MHEVQDGLRVSQRVSVRVWLQVDRQVWLRVAQRDEAQAPVAQPRAVRPAEAQPRVSPLAEAPASLPLGEPLGEPLVCLLHLQVVEDLVEQQGAKRRTEVESWSRPSVAPRRRRRHLASPRRHRGPTRSSCTVRSTFDTVYIHSTWMPGSKNSP